MGVGGPVGPLVDEPTESLLSSQPSKATPAAVAQPIQNAPKASLDAQTSREVFVPEADVFAEGRWPGLAEAFAFCNQTAGAQSLLGSGDARQLWTTHEAVQRLESLGHGEALKVLKRRMGALELAESHLASQGAGFDPLQPGLKEKLERDCDAKREAFEAEVQRVVEALSEVTNPTLQGRTWLLDWEIPTDRNNRVELRREAALVVAPAGVILQPGMTVMLIHAADRASEDRDMMVHQIQRQPLLVSEAQRQHWGMGMALKQRVFYIYAPDLELPGAKRRGRKPKKTQE